jgi:hypothetical protein
MNVETYSFPTHQEAMDAAVRIYNFLDVIAIVMPPMPGETEFMVGYCAEHDEKVRNFLQEGN